MIDHNFLQCVVVNRNQEVTVVKVMNNLSYSSVTLMPTNANHDGNYECEVRIHEAKTFDNPCYATIANNHATLRAQHILEPADLIEISQHEPAYGQQAQH